MEKLKRAYIQPPIIKGKVLFYPDAVGLRYWRRLQPIINSMLMETESEVKELMATPAAYWAGLSTQDASISEQVKQLFNRLTNKYLRIFNRDIESIVLNMMAKVDKASQSNLRDVISDISSVTITPDYFVKSMGEQFKALTEQNVSLFKTIPEVHFAKVETAVMDSIISGNGLKDLNPFFEQYTTGERNYAKNRAMDQTRKAYTSINMARMQKSGIKQFEWLHSHGSNAPRKLHEELSGKVFDIASPPYIGTMYNEKIYGYPGQLPNCRCMARPIIDLSDDDD